VEVHVPTGHQGIADCARHATPGRRSRAGARVQLHRNASRLHGRHRWRPLGPIGGSIFANVDANLSGNYLVPEYVYKTETPKVSFASSAMVPIFWVGATGSLQLSSNNFAPRASSSNGGVGDMVALPLTVGIHFSENNNLAVSTMIFAPTGQWRPANLSNLGMGSGP